MSDEQHAADVHNIEQGDDLTLTTEDGRKIRATCQKFSRQNARDPDVVRTDLTWYFEAEAGRLMLQITEGLRRFEWEADYPRHKPLFNTDDEKSVGFAHIVKIHGKA